MAGGASEVQALRHKASTLFLRIPLMDWPAITQGLKTELRMAGRGTPHVDRLRPPCPIVGYARGHHSPNLRTAMLVLEEAWSEPLGAISPESLRNEGFDSIREFRRYWRKRHRQTGYRALTRVSVFRLRAWRPDDEEEMGRVLLHRLYGEFIGAET